MASMKRGEDERGPYWDVRWRDGGRGRAGTSRSKRHRRKGLADEHFDKVRDTERRRGAGLSGGDGSWTVERFFFEKFLPLRSPTVTAGTVGSWRRRWTPKAERASVWHVCRWAGWSLEDINAEAILEWHAIMRRRGATDATMFRCHDLLVSIMSFAVKLHYVQVNAAHGMQPKYKPKRTTGIWMPDTIERIRQVFIDRAQTQRYRAWDRQRDAVLIAVLAYCGLRPGEALALTWGQVLERSLWVTHTIPGLDDDATGFSDGRTKTGTDRGVPMPSFIIAMLNEWRIACRDRRPSAPVFPTAVEVPEPWSYNKWVNWRKVQWVPALEAAGVEYRKPYHLRHSCVTMWIYSGCNIIEAAGRAGHTPETCMKTYAHRLADFDPSKPLNIETAYHEARNTMQTPNVRRLRAV